MRINGVEYELVRAVALAAENAGVEPALLAAIVAHESAWDPNAEGDRDGEGVPHSFGLGQLHDRGAGAGHTPEELKDPVTNARLAAGFLKRCLTVFPDVAAAICAYNAGIQYVRENGWQWNQDRYVLPVLASKAAWQRPVEQAGVLMHLDAIWGLTVEIDKGMARRGRCERIRQHAVAVKRAVGLD